MKRCHAAVLSLLLSGGATAVPAQNPGPSGEDVVDVVCARCHATGAQGAPRIGDRAAWARRIQQGIATLSRHALYGIREMPAHGGDSSLSDLMVRRAVVYMVNRSGGSWVEPTTDANSSAGRSGAQVVQTRCGPCHDQGYSGAPRVGDRAAWTQRLRLGIDPLVRSVSRAGSESARRGGMSQCGGLASVSDEEIRAAIIYMASQVRTLAADPSRRTYPR